jgi:hypothetical protein
MVTYNQCFIFGRNFSTWRQKKKALPHIQGFFLRKNGLLSPHYEGKKLEVAKI